MRKYLFLCILSLVCTAALSLLVAACGPAGRTGPAGPQGGPVQQETPPAGADLYTKDLKPLAPEECGRCHTYQFNWLKDRGGKHQLDCAFCHEKFHAYNPKLDNWDAIMPRCQGCHQLPHDNNFSDCMECHLQPHAPMVIEFAVLEQPVSAEGEQHVLACAKCHNKEGTEFAGFPSKHNSAVNCNGCHANEHGTIPSCLDCHDPHLATQEYRDCLECHAPHSASTIRQYSENVPNVACSACHDDVYDLLQGNVTRHSAMQCATCHPTHGRIQKCQDCHGAPHGDVLHQRFADCLECHIDPHNLPVNLRK